MARMEPVKFRRYLKLPVRLEPISPEFLVPTRANLKPKFFEVTEKLTGHSLTEREYNDWVCFHSFGLGATPFALNDVQRRNLSDIEADALGLLDDWKRETP